MSTVTKADPWLSIEPYKVSVDEYRAYRRDGYLIVRGLVEKEHVEELLRNTDDLMYDRIEVPGAEPLKPNATMREIETRLLRIHMLHTQLEIWERYLLYPRVLDVVQALTGPDVAAMQTMMFIKGPGAYGQGFHQDSYYIPTFPDTLIGACRHRKWMSLDVYWESGRTDLSADNWVWLWRLGSGRVAKRRKRRIAFQRRRKREERTQTDRQSIYGSGGPRHSRTGRRRVLWRAYSPSITSEPLRESHAPQLRKPLLQRKKLHDLVWW